MSWDEPTSQYAGGQYGGTSVFNEGRASLLTITKPISEGSTLENVETETDMNVLSRLGELAVCSNFQRVELDESNHELGICVAKTTQTHVRKRSLLTRHRRSGEVHHPSVKSILLKVRKYLNEINATQLEEQCTFRHVRLAKTSV